MKKTKNKRSGFMEFEDKDASGASGQIPGQDRPDPVTALQGMPVAPVARSPVVIDDTLLSRAQGLMPEGRPTTQITARFDSDTVDWFRAQGRGYQARMNAVLRAYYEFHKGD